jgi:hypothetical protein
VRPPETTAAIISALSDYCTAAAQSIVLKKALLEGKTSKIVVAKLSCDVWRKLESVEKVIKEHQLYPKFEIGFYNYVSFMKGFSKAIAYKSMGDVAYEAG